MALLLLLLACLDPIVIILVSFVVFLLIFRRSQPWLDPFDIFLILVFLLLITLRIAHLVLDPYVLTFLVSMILLTVLLSYHHIIYVTIKTMPTTLRIIQRLLGLGVYFRSVLRDNMTVGSLLENNAKNHPEKILFYFHDETWTYHQINVLANKVANYFQELGFRKGDVVGLFMENRPEHPAIWIGLNKIGVVSSIVNTNLRQESLRATLQVSSPKATIYDDSTAEAIQGMLKLGEWTKPLFSFGLTQATIPGSKDLREILKNVDETKPRPTEVMNVNDELFYIYTSGSTGLPKAVSYKNSRFLVTAASPHYLWGVNHHDVVYTALPLYHMTAAVTGVGVALTVGASLVMRRKFSASKFWKDCVDYKVTVVQYIGEICRYLLRQPIVDEERQHSVRAFVGSGLRGEIWEEFVTRFGIQDIGEVYGATESNCGLINFDGTAGAIGFIPRLLYPHYPAALIKVDEETEEPIRDPDTGLAIKCEIGEPGEWVGKIIRNHPLNDFSGYKNAECDKKILRDIFKKGDEAYRSNDLMVMNELGYIRFKDRAALNFRWKGENVSSVEVENTISRLVGLKDVAVYGVKIPETDGNPGMATIADPERSLDLKSLAFDLKKQLPGYAMPIFIRITKSIETTGTYKTFKKDLRAEGFDVTRVKDPIYIHFKGSYTLLDTKLYAQVISGELHF